MDIWLWMDNGESAISFQNKKLSLKSLLTTVMF